MEIIQGFIMQYWAILATVALGALAVFLIFGLNMRWYRNFLFNRCNPTSGKWWWYLVLPPHISGDPLGTWVKK